LNAEEGIKEMKKYVDTFIVIPNDKIALAVEKGTPLLKSFALANDILRMAVQSISDIILTPGLINVDFADVRTIIEDKGRGVMGSGLGSGEGGALEAAKKAITNPLLEDPSIEGAKGVLINITGGLQLSLDDVKEAASFVYDSAHDEVNLIFGAVVDPDLDDEVRVTVIATGFNEEKQKAELPQIKKWAPVREPLSLKGSDRVLSKSLKQVFAEELVTTDFIPYEDPIDIPAFMRKSPPKQI
jgi:cell division protein FtsZ